MGIIAIEKIRIRGKHGVYESERVQGNLFEVSIYLETDWEQRIQSDALSQTLDYSIAHKCTQKAMRRPARLLEVLCLRIAREVWQAYPKLASLTVRIAKLSPPLEGEVEKTFVEAHFTSLPKEI